MQSLRESLSLLRRADVLSQDRLLAEASKHIPLELCSFLEYHIVGLSRRFGPFRSLDHAYIPLLTLDILHTLTCHCAQQC